MKRFALFVGLLLSAATALAQIQNPPTWNPPQPPIFIGSSGQVLAVQPSGALAFQADPGGPLPTIATSSVLGNVSGSAAPATAIDALAVINMQNAMVAVTVSSITNVATLSGSQVITTPANATITPTNGQSILLGAQSTASQNGIWIVNSAGAWTRPLNFPSGDVVPSLCAVTVRDNTTGTLWVLDTSSAVTIDTSNQSWSAVANLFAVGNGVAVQVLASSGTTAGHLGGILTLSGGKGAFTGTGNSNGGSANLQGGAGGTAGNTGQGIGGAANVVGGAGGGTTNGSGGAVNVTGGGASATAAGTANGGALNLTGGNGGPAANGNGGSLNLKPGANGGTGTDGIVNLEDSSGASQIQINRNGPLYLGTTTATLPACAAATTNVLRVVTDANAPTFGSIYASGGAVTVLVLCNGTNWLTY